MKDAELPLVLYVNSLNQIPFICPKCNFSKLITVNELSHRKCLLKLKCRCKRIFNVQLEFRRYFRKETNLKGTLALSGKDDFNMSVSVVNLSRGGACFESNSPDFLKIGDQGTLTFRLDDKPGTLIVVRVVIKTIKHTRIGSEFMDLSEYERALGFYLMSQKSI